MAISRRRIFATGVILHEMFLHVYFGKQTNTASAKGCEDFASVNLTEKIFSAAMGIYFSSRNHIFPARFMRTAERHATSGVFRRI